MVFYGGVAYTAGAMIEYFRLPPVLPSVIGAHDLFHICVLMGPGLHWRFIYRLVKQGRCNA